MINRWYKLIFFAAIADFFGTGTNFFSFFECGKHILSKGLGSASNDHSVIYMRFVDFAKIHDWKKNRRQVLKIFNKRTNEIFA